MERPPFKRKGDDPQDGSRKSSKSNSAPGKKMSFAERMMQKMGHKEGQGLGKEGTGIIEPIQVSLRPSKVGVGAVKEKTAQHKREEKRAAEKRGEVYVDSSEEEREAEKRRRKIKKGLGGAVSSSSTPGRVKPKFSVTQLESEGLHIPKSLGDIYDMTSGAQKKITDIRLHLDNIPAESETTRIAKRAKKDLEAFGEAWHSLSEEKNLLAFQEEKMEEELQKLESEVDGARRALEVARLLQNLPLDDVLSKFETIPLEYQDDSLLIAAVHPLLRDIVSKWDPLENSSTQTAIVELSKIDAILKRSKSPHATELNKHRKKTTTPYESLILAIILPKLRESILSWDVELPNSMLSLIQTIEPLLPRFVLNKVLNDLVAKLTRAVHDFNPRLALKKKSRNLLHLWVIPILQLQFSPDQLAGLLSVVRGKLRTLIDIFDVTRGPLPGLSLWKGVFPDLDKMLLTSVVPRLSEVLRLQFEVDPTDQDLTLFQNALSFNSVLSRPVMAELLIETFFPKFFSTLGQWMASSSVNYDEVSQWYLWWKTQLPAELNELRSIENAWESALHQINAAINGEPFVEHSTPETPQPVISQTPSKDPPRRVEVVEEATFKDIVEEWCGEENLMLIPLREAEITTGLPLYRITASATGRGGVVVYIRGDVLYAAEKKDRTKWKPVGLGSELIELAEGK